MLKIVAVTGALLFLALPLVLILAAPQRTEWLLHSGIGLPWKAHGDLRVTSRPVDAEVYVDGTLRGVTPLVVELHPGKHTIRIGSPRIEHWRAAEVNVKEGVEHRLDIDLTQ
jgi:hypothetical protein